MTTTEQAKKGFKTFLITLSVSLVLFSFIYYIVTDSKESYSIDDVKKDEVSVNTQKKSPEVAGVADTKVAVVTSTPTVEVKQPSEQKSLFGEINKKQVPTNNRTVLAGYTQSSQSSVPETGFDSITYALIGSAILLGIGIFVYLYGPRKIAMQSFEREVIRSLDKDL